MRRSTFVLLCLVLAMSGACGTTTPPDSSATPTAAATHEGVDGSSTSTPDELLGTITFAGSTTVQPLAETLGEAYRVLHPHVELDIGAGGSGVGIQAVQNGDVDIGMASRRLKEDEQTEGMIVHQIAVDVLGVIVHPDNPIDDISLEELQGIFTGQITNWREVGGPDAEILVVLRDKDSGTRGAFDEIVLHGKENTPNASVHKTAAEVAQQVVTSPNAIGYIGFGHVNEAVMKVLTVDGVAPSTQTATDGIYTLQRPLNLLTGPLSQKLAMSFVEFALSDEGQRLVAEDGWVPIREPSP